MLFEFIICASQLEAKLTEAQKSRRFKAKPETLRVEF